MGSPSNQVTIVLPTDAALVAEALLDQLEEPAMLDVRDPADVAAVWALSEVLQKTLPQLLDPQHKTLLAEARTRLRETFDRSVPTPASSSPASGNSLAFVELNTGEKWVAVVRPVSGGATVSLSRTTGGNCEVTFAAGDLKRFKELLVVAGTGL